jgi:hypothetical protein
MFRPTARSSCNFHPEVFVPISLLIREQKMFTGLTFALTVTLSKNPTALPKLIKLKGENTFYLLTKKETSRRLI